MEHKGKSDKIGGGGGGGEENPFKTATNTFKLLSKIFAS